MARPRRIEFSGALYHVTCRGNAREAIYWDDSDRELFLKFLVQVIDRYRFLCYGYCLMDNHYHLLIETHDPNLSGGMRHLNGLYTQRFNRQHHRVGHLFQGRFKAILVEKESYLLELCRYMVLNPVRAGLVQDPAQWAWSSYRALIGEVEVPRWLSADWVWRQFDTHRKSAQKKYTAFVLAGLQNPSPWGKLCGQIYLGSKEFCGRFAQDEPLPEVPKLQRQPVRPTLEEIFREGRNRQEQVVQAFRSHGYRLKEIAEHLSVHYATISRWVKQAERQENIQDEKLEEAMLDCKT